MRHHLAEGWTLSAVPGSGPIPPELHDLSVPATVPGCVHTDLLEVGPIPDPYLDRNEAELQWLGVCAWRYQCSFEAGPEVLAHERVELVCEGLDTVASLELNGEPLGEAANMHRPHRFDLGGRLRSHNDLVITFHSSLHYAEALRDTLGERPNAYPLPFNFVRKMACNFGWDWGPMLVTAGIWQPIYLEAWSGARIASLRPLSTSATGLNWAQISLQVELDWAPNAGEGVRLEASLPRPDRIELGVEGASLALEPGQREAVLRFEVDSPLLWWPRGHGEQPLYDLEVLLSDGDDRTLARRESRCGFRRVELDTTTDATGSRFAFRINDKEIFVRGANWIPDDCFPTRVDERRYRQRIQQACDANMNMLRVCGGGIYEQEAFYQTCDELGGAGVAGLSLLLRRLSRGGAASQRGGGRGAAPGRPPQRPPQSGAVERQQREPVGSRRLGLA